MPCASACSSLSCHPRRRASNPHPIQLQQITRRPAWFVDVAAQAGFTVLNVNGGIESKRYIIEATGSGVAILDYDRDGWPDIFLVNGTSLLPRANTSMRELPIQTTSPQQPRRHLHRRHRKAGLTSTGWGQGVCVGDYDNDGYDDIYVTGYGKNRLYHNQATAPSKK